MEDGGFTSFNGPKSGHDIQEIMDGNHQYLTWLGLDHVYIEMYCTTFI